MTKEEIIELAQKSASVYSTTTNFFHLSPNQLEHFADLVAAKERERCAKECEKLKRIESYEAVGDVAKECAEAIRSLK